MKKLFLLVVSAVATVSAEAYSGLVENLKNRAVTWQREYTYKEDNGVTKTTTNTCFVLGSPDDYSPDWWDHTKEAVYDGYTWYTHTVKIDDVDTEVHDAQGYFEVGDADSWAGYQLRDPMHVTKIRFWAGKDATWSGRVARSRGVKLQGANSKDFSDAVTFYTINEDNYTLSAGPIDIAVSNEFLTNTFTYVRMWAPSGNCCGNVAEVEFYGVESLVKPLAGTIVASEAESSHEATLATDGNISTYYKSSADGGYWGLDLGTEKRVCGVRFIPEDGQTWRCEGYSVQCANQPDFSDAVTITPDWRSFTNLWAFTKTFDAVSARYVRFQADSGRPCSLAEVEFFAPYETPTETPALTASATEGEAVAVKLTWTVPVNACSKIAFERATAPGGPYTVAGTADVASVSWSDPTSLGGITYYYKAKFIDEDPSGTAYAGALSANYASAKGNMQLDRDATGALRTGCTAIGYMTPYNDSGTAANLFDGDLSTASDYKEWSASAGVDLGQACVVSRVSAYPRSGNLGRFDGIVIYGYNGASDTEEYTWHSSGAAITAAFATNETGCAWYSVDSTSTSPVQCVFSMSDGSYANMAEMKVYGYRVADVAGVLLAPLTVTCVWKSGDAVVTWETCQNAVSYRLERKERAAGDSTAAWSAWTTIAEGLTATTYRDKTTQATKDYVYRLVSVKEENVAYSDDIAALGDHGRRGFVFFIQ